MWDIARSTSQGHKVLRRFISCAVTVLTVVFLCLFALSPNAYAADATWNSNSQITYDGDSYSGPANDSIIERLNLNDGSKAYTFLDPSAEELKASDNTVDTDNYVRKVHVIYFAPETDISTATSANYLTYTYISSTSYSNPSAVTVIAINQQSEVSDSSTSACKVEASGLAWIVCPISNLLASGTDTLLDALTTLLTIKPLLNDNDSPMYIVWSYMRNIANIAFLAGFMIIIYSQLTTFGVSNYGIKKLLPRLIIAAVLVNLSYFVCALAIDISNIIGGSIQDIFLNVRETLVSNGNYIDINWGDITSFILTGGSTAAVAGVVIGTIYGLEGIVMLLIPVLAGAFLAVLVALLVMAARQAIVTVLVILSPLAFVAYLLPNTEKWYEKWQSTMLTMLMMFPAFSLIFGGSQLAGTVIIQNADSVFTLLLGLAVQVVPLFLTPLLKNIGGPLLAKINDTLSGYGKSATGKVREFTKPRLDMSIEKKKAKAAEFNRRKPLDTSTLSGKIRRYTPGKRLAHTMDHSRREIEGRTKNYQGQSENSWLESNKYKAIHKGAYEVERDKDIAEQTAESELKREIVRNSNMLNSEIKRRESKRQAEKDSLYIDKIHEEIAAGVNTREYNKELSRIAEKALSLTINTSAIRTATETAKRKQQEEFEKAVVGTKDKKTGELIANELTKMVAGIGGERDIRRIQSIMKSSEDKRDDEDIAAMVTLFNSQTKPDNKAIKGAEFMRKALKENNVIETLASLDMLLTTGTAGKNYLDDIMKELSVEDITENPAVVQLNKMLLQRGAKEFSVSADKYAIQNEKTLGEMQQMASVYAGLNLQQFANQTDRELQNAFEVGVIDKELAETLLTNPQTQSNLTIGKRKFLQSIRDEKDVRYKKGKEFPVDDSGDIHRPRNAQNQNQQQPGNDQQPNPDQP